MRFRIGDRVKTPNYNKNTTGVVCNIQGNIIGVRHDKPGSGYHSCEGSCERDRGWFYSRDDLTLLEEGLPHQEVIEKIKYLQTKFENRHTKPQEPKWTKSGWRTEGDANDNF